MKVKIFLLLILLTIAVVSGIFIVSSRKEQEISPLGEKITSPTTTKRAESVSLKEYKDPAGFVFQYPDNVKVESNTPSDQSIFSSLNLTSNKYKGNIQIEVASSDLKSLDDWFRKNKVSQSSKDIVRIKLADLDASSFEQNGKLITLAVDVGTLFTFTVDFQKSKDFWLDVNKTILSSLAFQPPATSVENTSESAEGDVIFEGEEVVE